LVKYGRKGYFSQALCETRDSPLYKRYKVTQITDEYHDGGLEVHCTITYKLELLPQSKYWLPQIHVFEPKWLWEELMRDLEIYNKEE